jgi:hypothetical protein
MRSPFSNTGVCASGLVHWPRAGSSARYDRQLTHTVASGRNTGASSATVTLPRAGPIREQLGRNARQVLVRVGDFGRQPAAEFDARRR